MTPQPKIIKGSMKSVDIGDKAELSSDSTAQIDRLESRFKMSLGQESKSFEMIFSLLRDMNNRIVALEK